MYQNICPWCGKKIDRLKDRKGRLQKKTPLELIFAECHHCHNYYGQTVKSKRAAFSALGMLLSFILGILFDNGWIALFALVFIIPLLTSPLIKMNENEEIITEEKSVYIMTVKQEYQKISKNKYYYFSEDFESNPVFTQISPIYIRSYNTREKTLTFSFIYQNQSNKTVFDGTDKTVYNRKGKVCVIQNL